MPRIMAIDYGLKRTGIACTDNLQIIASPLDTVSSDQLLDFLKQYFSTENVEALVIGQAIRKDGTASPVEKKILELIENLEKIYPLLKIHRQDEHLTSQRASSIIRQSGRKKKDRRKKGLVDKVSAVLILQEFLGHI
ncbi:MAG: Holliday junction resolvase RuvX [Saprospiraceae bacterium]|nr:Holliday junction resolvase RuvX [Saprospiraceae bacterium]